MESQFLFFQFEKECQKLISLCEEIGVDDLQSFKNDEFLDMNILISELKESNLNLEDVKELFVSTNGEIQLSEVQKLNNQLEKFKEEKENKLREEQRQQVRQYLDI